MSFPHNEPVLALANLVRQGLPEDTTGLCLEASEALRSRLADSGISCSVQIGSFDGHPHAWLDVWLSDGLWWLDITADQFGGYPEVIFIPAFSMDEYAWEEPS